MEFKKLSAEELLEMKLQLQGKIENPNLKNINFENLDLPNSDINNKNLTLDIDNKDFVKNIKDPEILNNIKLEQIELPKLKENVHFDLPEDISDLSLTDDEIEHRRSK